MEVRRKGYSVLKVLKEHQELKESYYLKIAEHAHYTSLSYLHQTAKKKLTLKKVKPRQMIQVNEEDIHWDEEMK